MAAVFGKKKTKTKKGALGTGGCLAVQGHAVLSAILLTLHEGQLPANQLPSRMNKLDRVLGNREGRGETRWQYKVFHNNSNGDNLPNGAAIQISSESNKSPMLPVTRGLTCLHCGVSNLW